MQHDVCTTDIFEVTDNMEITRSPKLQKFFRHIITVTYYKMMNLQQTYF